jgi:hypothetical protein
LTKVQLKNGHRATTDWSLLPVKFFSRQWRSQKIGSGRALAVGPCIILHYAGASQRHNSAEPASEYFLLDPNAFESRKVAFSFLLTEKYRQEMLTGASQDNTRSGGRGRGQRHNAWLQEGRMYV